jgi:Fur family ferric uptake transcriptional regulator
LKATDVRRALLESLREEHGPFTLEELHRKIGRESCDLVTMYRTLAVFQRARLVRRCDFGDGSVRYEFFDPGSAHHHHVVCVQCRQVASLDDCALDPIEEKLRDAGYRELTHSLEFFGVCPRCASAGS